MSISYIRLAWNNEIQDITNVSQLKLDNTSTIHYTDGSKQDANASLPLLWKWYYVVNGVKTLVSEDFNFPPLIDGLPTLPTSGYILIQLECQERGNGRIWAHTSLSKVIYNLAGGNPPPSPPLWPGLPPSLNSTLSTQLLDACGQVMSLGDAAHFPAEHFVGGFSKGDMDANGIVNVQDLLLLNGEYGKVAPQ